MEILKRIEYECYGMFLMESIASRKGGGGSGLNSGKANVQLPKAVNDGSPDKSTDPNR